MRKQADKEIPQACQTHLRALQPVKGLQLRSQVVRSDAREADGQLVLDTEVGRLTYFYEIRRGLSLPRLEHFLLGLRRESRQVKARPFLIGDYLPPRIAERLVQAGVNFVDEAGNVYIHWPGKLYIRVKGGRPQRIREARARRLLRPRGLQVLFVLLAEPQAVSLSYREVAKASGVALGSVAQVMQELKAKGFLQQRSRGDWRLVRKRELVGSWVGGYGDVLRPKLVLGRFQPPERDVMQTLQKLRKDAASARISWVVTGGVAADLLTRSFRGDQLAFFASALPAELLRSLRWLPSSHGPVTVLRQFTPLVSFAPKEPPEFPVAHPLLIYAELLSQGGERELAAARVVYDRFLAPILDAD